MISKPSELRRFMLAGRDVHTAMTFVLANIVLARIRLWNSVARNDFGSTSLEWKSRGTPHQVLHFAWPTLVKDGCTLDMSDYNVAQR